MVQLVQKEYMKGIHWARKDYGIWKNADHRSKWYRHWEVKHSKTCAEYSPLWFGDICKITLEFFGTNTDLERINKKTWLPK